MIGKPPRQTIRDLLSTATIALQPKQITCAADRDLGRLEAEILLSHLLKKEKVWLLAHDDTPLSPAQGRRLQSLIRRRQKHEPIAYIIGEREFYGRPFIVNPSTLIPRPETELMVEESLRVMGYGLRIVIWDVGTGSGAIGVTLAAEIPHADVLATDISSRALSIAKKNATRHGVTKHVTFLKSNLLQPAAYKWLKRNASGRDTSRPHPTHPATQLVVVANLPYLPASDKKILAKDVVKYEPSSALFSGKDGLVLIKRFLGQLSRHLPEWGYTSTTILLEYDPPQTTDLKAIAKKHFPKATITVHRDLAGRDRMMEIVV